MNRITQLLLRIVFANVILIVACTFAQATIVTNRKDDIEIAVASKVCDSGKTLITCVISNHSPHTIATTNIQTRSSVFYFKLLDQFGKEIQQDPEWAKSFAQKSSERYKHPRSFRMDQVYPGKEIKFEFYLEDAYNLKSSNGQDMVVSWESSFLDKVVITSDYINTEGRQVKGNAEIYMFPPIWAISVSLPLKEDDVKELEKLNVSTSEAKSSGNETATLPNSSNPKAKIDSVEKEVPDKKSYLWWLLLIPLLLLVRYIASLQR